MIETWLCCTCPNCQKENWVNHGDPSDPTGIDTDALRCWNCDACWDLNSEEEVDEDLYGECIEDGRHFEEVEEE